MVQRHNISADPLTGAKRSRKSKAARLLVAAGAALFVESLERRLFFSAGATTPYTTYEAESGTYTGALIGPSYAQNTVAGESSGREAVQLNAVGQYVQINAASAANSLVVRYSIPDSSDGTGINSTLSLYINGTFVQKLVVTSTYSWQYGAYPFTNTPSQGLPRNFYDEVRTSGLTIHAGDTVRVERDSTDTAASYDTIDLMDLENVAAAITQPAGSISVTAAPYNAATDGTTDDTTAIQTAVNKAISQHKPLWVPTGNYKLTGFITGLHDVTIQGAGMWYTNFVGDPSVYNTTPADRAGFTGAGNNIHLNDFSIIGDLNYRNDSEANDGIGGNFGTGSSINDLWIEHTKVGMWLINSNGLTISNCRIRDTIADGINLSVGMQGNIISNCTTRGTGDDCFAIYPATYTTQTYAPGNNEITHCTGIAPYLANGGAIYGAAGNTIDNCLFQDINYGAGILISTTFDVGTNTFSGATTVRDSTLLRDGGSATLAAVQLTGDLNPITGVALSNLALTSNPYSGLGVHKTQTISNSSATGLTIGTVGLASASSYGVYIESIATGALTITNSTIGDYNQAAANFNLSLSSVTGPLPSPWIAGDINAVGVKGSTTYNNGIFTVAGAGSGISSSIDGFRFVSQNVTGDYTLTSNVLSLQNTGTSPMAGLMFRNDTTTSSPYAGVFVTPAAGLSFQYRSTAGGSITTTAVTGVTVPVELQLMRTGNAFSALYSTNGSTWHQIGATTTITLNATAMVGMAVSSANKTFTATSSFNLVNNPLVVNVSTDPATISSGVVSLRDALAYAATQSGAQQITFDSELTGTLTLTSPIVINSNVTIAGPTATALTIQDNTNSDLEAASGTAVAISNLNMASSSVVLQVDPGSQTTLTNVGLSGSVVANGLLLINTPEQLTSLSIGSSGKVAIQHNSSAMLITTSGLTISNGGLLDLTSNDLIIHNATSAAASQTYNTASGWLSTGCANGSWNGNTGMISSRAGASGNHLAALGEAVGLASFDGVTVQTTDVLVKYTFWGDADLTGHVDGSDYSRIDSGYTTQSKGWFNGDFNYDNVINGSDYTLIDNAFNTQGASISTQFATQSENLATAATTSRRPAGRSSFQLYSASAFQGTTTVNIDTLATTNIEESLLKKDILENLTTFSNQLLSENSVPYARSV